MPPRIARGLVLAALLTGALVACWLWSGWDEAPVLLGGRALAAIRGVAALLGLVLLAAEARARRRARPLPTRAVQASLASLAAVAVCACLYSARAGGSAYHRWEMFHYYLGAKYQAELGYRWIYACTAIAESELGPEALAQVRLRRIRNLETGLRETTEATLADPAGCKARFLPERWQSFKEDVAFFRSQMPVLQWERVQTDHGYNAPPLWTAVGKLLASAVPASTSGLGALACLDLVLLSGAFFAVWWAFGWRALTVALLFWATALPGNEVFTAGAFLRQDWLFFTVLSVCLARRGRPFLSGASLATASLLRLFPALLFAGPFVLAVARWRRTGHLQRRHARALLGAVLAGAALALASAAITGPGSFPELAARLWKHQATPLSNNMGLPQVLAYRPSQRMMVTVDYAQLDPYARWAELQRQERSRAAPVLVLLALAIAALFAGAVARLRTPWIAQVLGLSLIATFLALTCYYYAVFVLAALLVAAHRSFGQLALLAAGVSALLGAWPAVSRHWDDASLAQSLLFIALSWGLLLAFWRRRRPPGRIRRPTTS